MVPTIQMSLYRKIICIEDTLKYIIKGNRSSVVHYSDLDHSKTGQGSTIRNPGVYCFQTTSVFTVVLAELNEFLPVGIEPEEFRVTHDDQQGLASRHGNIESEIKNVNPIKQILQ